MNILKNKLQVFVTLVFLSFVGWWISFQAVVDKQGTSVNSFENAYGVVALIGAIVGFIAMRKWGGPKTLLGKALLFFSLGLFAQEAGQLIYSYYVQIDKIQIPYPSWGDAAYFGSVLFYITGAFFLARAAGAKFSLKQPFYKIIVVIIPVFMVSVSYLILLHNHQYDTSKPLTVFLDAGYPIGESIYISIAILAYLLSRRLLGGVMRAGILLVILALFVQYIADFTFVFQGNRGTYVPGKYDDLFYLITYFVAATAMIKFYTIYRELKNKTKIISEDKNKDITARETG